MRLRLHRILFAVGFVLVASLLWSSELRGQDLGNISGQIRLPGGGFPSERILVTLQGRGAIINSSYCDNEGRFGFSGLVANPYYVVIETEGYQPVGLNDPRRIEETITAEAPSVILLDVVMPERNGFQVCRELKNNAKFNTIPVILVTSKDTPSDRYWGEQQGADGYVTKPFTREELLRAVRRFA